MKNRFYRFPPVFLIIILLATGCNFSAPTPSSPVPDVDATVKAAVDATEAAKSSMQTAIEVSVAQTTTALPPAILPPTPTPVDGMTLSEEELAALIDQSVNEAITAYELAATTTSSATSDGTLTQEEIDAAAFAYAYADDEIEAAMALAATYLDLYYDLASETVVTLEAVEQDLSAMAEVALTTTDLLVEMGQSLAAGQEIRAEAITQLQDQAQTAAGQAQEIKDAAGTWNTGFKEDLESRTDKFSNIQPDQVAGDRRGSLQLATDYFNEVRSILQGGGRITTEQMTRIAQLGSNASNSLRGVGGPEMQNISERIDGMTRQISRGELPQARSGLGELERSIPRR